MRPRGNLPPPLTHEQTAALLARHRQGDPAALDALVRGHLRLVMSKAKAYRGRGIEEEELFSLGCIGLMDALASYDPGRGMAFASYVGMNADGRIRNAFRYRRLHREYHGISLDAPAQSRKPGRDGASGPTALDTLADPSPDILETLATCDNARRAMQAVDELPDAELRSVIRLRFCGPEMRSQKEVGKLIGLSQMTVSRREKAAIAQCRAILAAAGIMERTV